MVHGEQQQVVVGREPHQAGAERRCAGEIKRLRGVIVYQAPGYRGLHVRDGRGQVHQPQRTVVRRINHLLGAAVGCRDAGSQALVTTDQFGEGALQRVLVKPALQADRAGDVVGRAGKSELFEEPQTLLRE